MALSSMTGFARADGVCGTYVWGWELKSVNGKGLDIRMRVPAGWDAVEAAVRARTKPLSRGTVYANLSVRREGVAPTVKVNEPVLAAVLATVRDVGARVEAQPPTIDGILGIRGVMDVVEQQEGEEEHAVAETAVIAGFEGALSTLLQMRTHEGAALGHILNARLDEIAGLSARADAAPGRQPEAIKAKLGEQIKALLDTLGAVRCRPAASGGDPDGCEGGRARRAGSARGARCAGTRTHCRRRRHRPAARFPLAGA